MTSRRNSHAARPWRTLASWNAAPCEPHATPEVAAAAGLPGNETLAAIHELATHEFARRIAIGDEDELWCFRLPSNERRCRRAPARPEPVERELAD